MSVQGHHRHKISGGGQSRNQNRGNAEISIVLAVPQYQASVVPLSGTVGHEYEEAWF